GDLLPDLSHFGFKFFARFLSRTSSANLLAQTVALRLQPLQFSLPLAPLGVDSQHLVDLGLISAAARRQALANEIRFLANQTDVEHGASMNDESRMSNQQQML